MIKVLHPHILPPGPTLHRMKVTLKKILWILGAIALIYFVTPFIWSAIEIGVKGWIFELMVDYGIYIFLLIAGGGYLWWKFRKFKNNSVDK